MNKRLLSLPGFFCLVSSMAAQFVEVSYGPNYSQQAFYTLESNTHTALGNSEWDIAFSTIGLQDAAIFINEAAGSSESELEAYLAPTNNFDDVIDPEMLDQRLFNDELSWDFGAFNSHRSPDNALDFGWGLYNPGNHSIEGATVFVLKLRDEGYKKLLVESLASTTYTFKYADLDGSNEITQTINKADFPNSDLAYFSLSEGQTINLVPADWDLWFTRYITPLDDGNGGILDYAVTGVLSGPGVEIAQADGIDPETVTFAAYEDSLKQELDIIGYDWKTFDLSTFQWSLPLDRAYFVKTKTGEVWKIIFIDFEGSGTGNAVFQRTALGTVSTLNPSSAFTDCTVFPNPIAEETTLTFSLKNTGLVRITIVDIFGRVLWTNSRQAQTGFNALVLPNLDLSAGTYYLTVEANGDLVTQILSKS